jgi:hypothetical protein
MFAVARDFLLIPRAKVNIKRLFNITRNILGLWHIFISKETLRALILLKDYMRRVIANQV